MGRIFTVDFNYREKVYPALVKISAGQHYFAITYHVPDPSLHSLLPGGMVSYNNREGLSALLANEASALDLVTCITNAVEEHLHSLQSDH